MADEKSLFGRQKGFRGANDRPESGGHLDGDQDKDNDPGVEPGRGSRLGVGKARFEEAQAKKDRDEPEQ